MNTRGYIQFEQILFILALIWYSLTAYYSIGYYHADEHYQIIEFAGIIDGSNTAEDLPWEFKAKIRSALQPTIAHFIFKTCELFSIYNPYNKTFLLRLLTGIMSVISILFFTNSCKELILKKYWKPFLILSYFTWFIPFLSVRFSSETYAGITLLSTVAIIIKDRKNYNKYLISGIFLGLSFLFRYQIAISGIGIVLWLLFIKKENFNHLITFISAILIIVVIGLFLDSWFYNEPNITFWNYLKVNIFEGKAAEFGVSPWYYYLVYSAFFSFLPIGLSIISAFVILLYKKPKSIFIWTILPFIIVHSFIGHKELRFLFPIINFIPIVLILSLQEINWKYFSNRIRKFATIFLLLLFISNLTGILLTSFIAPLGNSRVKITKKIKEIGGGNSINLVYASKSNPYLPWGLKTNFYSNNKVNVNKIELDNNDFKIPYYKNKTNMLVVTYGDLQNSSIINYINQHNLKEVCKGIPDYSFTILKTIDYNTEKVLFFFSE